MTTTFDYDSLGRVSQRYTSLGYSDYIYEDGTDWLLHESWHSYVPPYNVFDLVRYWYLNGRPIRMEYAWNPPSDLSSSGPYDTVYFQYNWHGDVAARVPMDGAGGATMGTFYEPWGNSIEASPVPWHYYRWNGGWGYLQFVDLGMYYVHGRWYRPDLGRFISPDEKGEYLYGSGNDAINWVWVARRRFLGEQSINPPISFDTPPDRRFPH